MNIRHGDLSLVQKGEINGKAVKFDTLPKGLAEIKTDVLMKGSHGNDHAFKGGKFYPITDNKYPFLIGYFVAGENCTLHHVNHGKKQRKGLRIANVPTGIYGVVGQHEDTHEGMQRVVD